MKSPVINHVSFVGAAGLFAQISLEQANGFVSLLVGLSTLAYVVTRTVYLIKKNSNEK